MQKLIYILVITLSLISCATIKSTYETNSTHLLFKKKLEFKKNGTCIFEWHSNGSDSGSYTKQHLGSYKYANDTITVDFFAFRSQLDRVQQYNPMLTIENRKWLDGEEFTQKFALTEVQDTLQHFYDSRFEFISSTGKKYSVPFYLTE